MDSFFWYHSFYPGEVSKRAAFARRRSAPLNSGVGRQHPDGIPFGGYEMQWFLVIAMSLMLLGCDATDLLEMMMGHKYEVVVLAKDPLVLDKKPLVLHPAEPMKIIGNEYMVCLVLRGDVSSSDSGSDELFKQMMSGATVDISIKLKSGGSFQFYEPMQAWRRKGRILKTGEFSACASTCCGDKDKPSKGTEATEVRIVSSRPLKVQGIYWESTNAFDEIPKKP